MTHDDSSSIIKLSFQGIPNPQRHQLQRNFTEMKFIIAKDGPKEQKSIKPLEYCQSASNKNPNFYLNSIASLPVIPAVRQRQLEWPESLQSASNNCQPRCHEVVLIISSLCWPWTGERVPFPVRSIARRPEHVTYMPSMLERAWRR
jgi:hypothetical protein